MKRPDPTAHAEFKQRRNDRARELLAERQKDHVAHAEFLQRKSQRAKEAMAERRSRAEQDDRNDE